MSELAVVILAHSDPKHVQRLVHALEEVPVFLHCDVKTDPQHYREMSDLPSRVVMLPRVDTRLSSWTLVLAELSGLQVALTATDADHVAVLTGSDYPLVPVDELVALLARWRGHSYIYNRRLPFPLWSTRLHPDGGEWRSRYAHLSRRGNLVWFAGHPLHSPVKRKLPPGLELRASSQWKIYSRDHIQLLLDVADSRPDLMRFWRSTHTPEESFAASVLSSAAIVGSRALSPCLANPWYYEFPPGAAHPKWLSSPDFHRIAAARFSAPIEPAVAFADSEVAPPLQPHRKLFARKFSSADPEVLDRIDAELRRWRLR